MAGRTTKYYAIWSTKIFECRRLRPSGCTAVTMDQTRPSGLRGAVNILFFNGPHSLCAHVARGVVGPCYSVRVIAGEQASYVRLRNSDNA